MIRIRLRSLKLNLSDDLSIDFKVSEQERKDVVDTIESMPHWRNEDGSWNHQAVVEDGVKIKYHDKIVKLAYEQGINAGKEALLKETKNNTLGNQTQQQSTKAKKGSTIEDFDKIIGKQSLGLKFRK